MNTTTKIHLTEEKETLLITLYAKALDYRSKNPILYDQPADELIKKIDYDFSKHWDKGNKVIAIRAREFDDWIRKFIRQHEEVVVLYLGCGLDTRINRIEPPSHVTWFDLDYPEVIKLRKTFYSNTDKYRMIESPVTDLAWLKQVPHDKATIIIAEGLLEYLSVEEVTALLTGLTNHFIHGQIIFDVMNSFAIKSGKKNLKATTGAVHKWAVNDASEVDQLNPKLKRITDLPLFKSKYMRKLSFGSRLLFGILSVFPAFKNMMQLLRYEF